jgi:hypothetical protein
VNADSGSRFWRIGPARWVAAGFVLAFATSVFTVIYTGLMVEGSRAEFDAGFRSLDLRVNEVQTVRFYFDAEVSDPDARLELDLPAMIEPATPREGGIWRQSVAVAIGDNEFAVELRAVAAGSGYVIARLTGEQPIGRDSVFVTVSVAAQ